jgi:hypothetical protein
MPSFSSLSPLLFRNGTSHPAIRHLPHPLHQQPPLRITAEHSQSIDSSTSHLLSQHPSTVPQRRHRSPPLSHRPPAFPPQPSATLLTPRIRPASTNPPLQRTSTSYHSPIHAPYNQATATPTSTPTASPRGASSPTGTSQRPRRGGHHSVASARALGVATIRCGAQAI